MFHETSINTIPKLHKYSEQLLSIMAHPVYTKLIYHAALDELKKEFKSPYLSDDLEQNSMLVLRRMVEISKTKKNWK